MTTMRSTEKRQSGGENLGMRRRRRRRRRRRTMYSEAIVVIVPIAALDDVDTTSASYSYRDYLVHWTR
jgi:hypothetical protein